MNNEEKMMSMLEALVKGQAETNQRLNTLEQDVSELKTDVDNIKKQQAIDSDSIDNIKKQQAIDSDSIDNIKKQQAIDSDSIDNIYKAVYGLRSSYESHSHDTKAPKISAV